MIYPAFSSASSTSIDCATVIASSLAATLRTTARNTLIHPVVLPILAGLTITLLQITTIDVVRLAITHTWGGFPLG